MTGSDWEAFIIPILMFFGMIKIVEIVVFFLEGHVEIVLK